MTRIRKIALGGLALFFVVVVGMVAWLMTSPGEPEFQGRSLTEWLGQAQDREELMTALHAMQPDAVPFLTRRLSWTPSPVARLRERFSDVQALRPLIPPSSDPRMLAAFGLGLLGPAAQQAAPELEDLRGSTSDSNLRLTATFALMRVQGEAPTDYIDRLTDTSDAAASSWYQSVSIVKLFGSEASNAIPHLIQALETTNNLNNWLIQAHACEALGSIRSQPEVCVPALVQSLQSADVNVRQAALRSLLQFGRDAQSARIALVECLHDPDPWIRTNTARLLEQIDSDKPAKSGGH